MIEWNVCDIVTTTWRFKKVEGHPDYIICDDGTVYGFTQRPRKPEKVFTKLKLDPSHVRSGHYKKYYRVNLWQSGKRTRKFIHRLVCSHFVGPIDGMHVDHEDQDTTNNNWWNLKPRTAQENYELKNERNGWKQKQKEAEEKFLHEVLQPEPIQDLHF